MQDILCILMGFKLLQIAQAITGSPAQLVTLALSAVNALFTPFVVSTRIQIRILREENAYLRKRLDEHIDKC